MKKFIISCLAVTALVSLPACSTTVNEKKDASAPNTTTTTEKTTTPAPATSTTTTETHSN